MPSKQAYYKVISKCDLVLSTSLHEFFGVALIEACLFGVYPLLPNRLVYPEIYPKECLYSTEAQLLKKLKYICTRPKMFRLLRQKNAASFVSPSHADDRVSLSDVVAKQIDDPNFYNKFKWSSLKNEFISKCCFNLCC